MPHLSHTTPSTSQPSSSKNLNPEQKQQLVLEEQSNIQKVDFLLLLSPLSEFESCEQDKTAEVAIVNLDGALLKPI